MHHGWEAARRRQRGRVTFPTPEGEPRTVNFSQPLRTRILLWAVASAAAVGAFSVSRGVGFGVLAVGVVALLLLSADPWPVRAATAAAVLPTAFGDGIAAWALPLAAALVALPAVTRSAAQVAGREQLQLHLDRARRREESVHVLFVRVTGGPALDPAAVADLFRLSDSIWLRQIGSGQDLLAVLDDHKLEREGVERRLLTSLAHPFRLGWAGFPADGYSLERLIEHARDAAEEHESLARRAPLEVGRHTQSSS